MGKLWSVKNKTGKLAARQNNILYMYFDLNVKKWTYSMMNIEYTIFIKRYEDREVRQD